MFPEITKYVQIFKKGDSYNHPLRKKAQENYLAPKHTFSYSLVTESFKKNYSILKLKVTSERM